MSADSIGTKMYSGVGGAFCLKSFRAYSLISEFHFVSFPAFVYSLIKMLENVECSKSFFDFNQVFFPIYMCIVFLIGQMDFLRGARLSNGGVPIIALPSTTSKGEPRIVATLKPGAGVVTTRSHVGYIVCILLL